MYTKTVLLLKTKEHIHAYLIVFFHIWFENFFFLVSGLVGFAVFTWSWSGRMGGDETLQFINIMSFERPNLTKPNHIYAASLPTKQILIFAPHTTSLPTKQIMIFTKDQANCYRWIRIKQILVFSSLPFFPFTVFLCLLLVFTGDDLFSADFSVLWGVLGWGSTAHF